MALLDRIAPKEAVHKVHKEHKVGRSSGATGGSDDRTSLIVTSEQPFGNCVQLGKMLQREGQAAGSASTAPKSFQPKELGEMICRIWVGLGVPHKVHKEHKAAVSKVHKEHKAAVPKMALAWAFASGRDSVAGLGPLLVE